jgi:hypothetical protein
MVKKERLLPDNTAIFKEAQTDLLTNATPALKDKINWIIAWCKKDARQSLLSRWDLGAQIAEVIQDRETRGCKVYGSKAFHAIAVFSGEAESSLRICAKMARFYTRGQIADLSETVMNDGVTPLSFSHMRAVLALDDPKTGEHDREEAINLTLTRCWTSEQLANYVKEKTEGRNSGNSAGRPLAVPRNLDALIHQQMSYADDFEKRNVKVWKNPEFSLTGQMARVQEEQYTEALASQLGKLLNGFEQVIKDAKERANETRAQLMKVRTVLDTKVESGVRLVVQASKEKQHSKQLVTA